MDAGLDADAGAPNAPGDAGLPGDAGAATAQEAASANPGNAGANLGAASAPGDVSAVGLSSKDAEDAAEARRLALAEAEKARSERARLAAEERAYLEGIREQQARHALALEEADTAFKAAQEAHFEQRRSFAERLGQAQRGGLDPAEADRLYDAIDAEIAALRARLAVALDTYSLAGDVPAPEPREVQLDAPEAQALLDLRSRLSSAAKDLADKARDLTFRRATAWREALDDQNAQRLAMIDRLSPARRSALVSPGPTGLDEVVDEASFIGLAGRYRLAAIGRSSASFPARLREAIAPRSIGVALLQVAFFLLLWQAWARFADARLHDLRHGARRRIALPTLANAADRALLLLSRVRGPLEAFLALWLLRGALGDLARAPEARFAWLALSWSLGGLLAVRALNALASARPGGRMSLLYEAGNDALASAHPTAAGSGEQAALREDETAKLRLRSLTLVARVGVAAGLLLSVIAWVVGKGALYTWTARLCGVAALVLFVTLVRRWRPVILTRIKDRSMQGAQATRADVWILRTSERWFGFFSTTVGAAILTGAAVLRWLRRQIAELRTSRRVLAHLARPRAHAPTEPPRPADARPLPDAKAHTFSPERPMARPISSIEAAAVERTASAIKARTGGIVALIGERGAGKTSFLRRVRSMAAEESIFSFSLVRGDKALTTLAAALEKNGEPPSKNDRSPPGGKPLSGPTILDWNPRAEPSSTAQAPSTMRATPDHPGMLSARAEDIIQRIKEAAPRAILIDDAQRIIRPAVGGLDELDELIAVARRASTATMWVLAIDVTVWEFVRQARGAEPMFDAVHALGPWTDESIAELLRSRTAAARMRPSFDDPMVVDIDGAERGARVISTELDYYRLLWDYAGGNPAVALTFWRRSLWESEGKTSVRLFDAPSAAQLDRLPDETLFVLRAVVQLGEPSAVEIENATMLPERQIVDALRFALKSGYIEPAPGESQSGRVRVTWPWYRAITRCLQRKHLLIMP